MERRSERERMDFVAAGRASAASADALCIAKAAAEGRPAGKMEEDRICLTAVLDEIERKLIEQALRKAGGNRTRAGNMLSLTRQTLNYKIKRLNIRVGS